MIEEDYLRVKMHLEEMIEKDKITSLRQQDAIKHALKEQKFEHQEEIKRTRETMMQDLQRVKDDFHHQIEMIKNTHEVENNTFLNNPDNSKLLTFSCRLLLLK